MFEETLANGLVLKNGYDYAGRRTMLTLPDSSSIQYGYDPLYLRSILRKDRTGTDVFEHKISSYDLSMNPIEERLIGDLGTLERRYDGDGLLVSLISPYSSHQVLDRDSMGNILQTSLDGKVSSFTYDDLSQLASEMSHVSHTYSVDAQYCRLQKDQESYEVNSLLQIPSHLKYDLNGNPVRHGNTEYVYDALDRLIEVRKPDELIKHIYDTDHRRLSRTVFHLKNDTWQEDSRDFYIFDGQNEIGKVDGSGQIVEFRVLGLTPKAEIGAAIAIELKGKIYAPIHDLSGNVHALVSIETREVVASYLYGVFGDEQILGTIQCPWRFASKREEAGLVYYGRRYYSTDLGRWLTPDPAGYVNGLNLYAFTINNPLRHSDAYGLIFYDDRVGSPNFFDPLKEKDVFFSFRDMQAIGNPENGTIDYYCGIMNTREDVYSAQACLYKTFEGEFAIQPHHIHDDSILHGLCTVGLRKLGMDTALANCLYLTCMPQMLLTFERVATGSTTFMGSPCEHTYENISRKAEKIISKGSADSIQLIIGFSKGCDVLGEVLSRMSSEYRQTAIVIAVGPTRALERNLGREVYNIIGDKDDASKICNGGLWGIEKAKEVANIDYITQTETQFGVGGHYFQQKDYQRHIKTIVNDNIRGKYEVY
jgi:RHS repeat-associated protein